METILKTDSYTVFKKRLIDSNCDKCPLANGRHNIVVDRGNSDAQVVIIGEAPGDNEDRQGRAFVGRAGRLLDQLLADLGFNTNQDSLIINVVKCRPPKNRPPTRTEVEACASYLEKQLELVRPKIVLLLGATAFKRMVGEKKGLSMTQEAGKFFNHPKFPNIQWMTLYHPAFILRDPRKKPLMVEHLKRFKAAYNKLCAECA